MHDPKLPTLPLRSTQGPRAAIIGLPLRKMLLVQAMYRQLRGARSAPAESYMHLNFAVAGAGVLRLSTPQMHVELPCALVQENIYPFDRPCGAAHFLLAPRIGGATTLLRALLLLLAAWALGCRDLGFGVADWAASSCITSNNTVSSHSGLSIAAAVRPGCSGCQRLDESGLLSMAPSHCRTSREY
jgi:hypothetical protein